MKLTPHQKLTAIAHRFYQDAEWSPSPGDFYTTCRADLELYQVVDVADGIVTTRYTEHTNETTDWPEADFLTSGFGPKRVWVPDFILQEII